MPVCAHCGEEHPLPGSYTSHVLTCSEKNGARGDEPIAADASETDPQPETHSLEDHVEQLIEAHLDDIEANLESLATELESVKNFTEISLGERRINQQEENLAEFSTSLTEFSEKTLDKVNDLETRLDRQTVILATILDALAADEVDVDVDVSPIEEYRQEQLVTAHAPEAALDDAIDAHQS